MTQTLKNKLKKIRLLILDVDGVMTNGEIVVDEKGQETKIYNVQDGFGIILVQRAGLKTAILTARSCGAVAARGKDLGMSAVCQDENPKLPAYQRLLKRFKLKDENACFVGDDLTDLPVLLKAGVSASVPNGAEEVKRRVDYVTKRAGGAGAVREVVELILKAQGKWAAIVEKYEK